MESVFASLPDDELRRILELKLDGYRNTEIVEKTGLSLATVERRLRRIRDLLAGYFKNSELGEEA